VGNSVSRQSEVVITSGKLGQADSIPSFRVEKNMAAAYDLEGKILQSVYLTVFAYDRKATLFVTVCGSVGIVDNHLVKCVKILRN